MITVAVLGILSAVAFPAFRAMIAGARIRTASFDAVSALTVARSEAVKRNAQVNLSPVGGNWRNGWTVSVGSTVLLRQAALSSGLSVTCYAGSAASACLPISYTGSGRLSPGTAMPSILISSGDTTSGFVRCISIDPSGRPRSAKASCI